MEITELSIEELKDKAVKIRIELDEERDTMCIDNYEEKFSILHQIEQELEER